MPLSSVLKLLNGSDNRSLLQECVVKTSFEIVV
jgi:hypothetical protein